MGNDVRKLAFDGYPGSNILGTDIFPAYLDAGHLFYNDKDTCPIKFLRADIFECPVSFEQREDAELAPLSQTKDLSQLRGSMTHVYTSSVFHLFDEATQYQLALRLASLLKRVPGAIIFGRHQGLQEEGKISDPPGMRSVLLAIRASRIRRY